MTGTIFDIKEFSIHDGPGGRITVFLKGCPLRCEWCHNPEGLSKEFQIMYKESLCVQCGRCKIPCEHPECKTFERCIHACANGALSISGTKITSDELAKMINESTDMLNGLGGGVTFSGGEPLMQADFLCDTIDKLNGVHTAIQTSGYADEEVYKRVIDKVDFIMQDIKIVSREKHKRYTGVYNDVIIRNIEYLKRSGKNFVFRVPMIPGITDTDENLNEISEIVKGYQVEYLKYNSLAKAKYPMLGMEYRMDTKS